MTHAYVLESINENERLKMQSEIHAYNLAEEFYGFMPRPGSKILDAGCGGGLVSDFLKKQVKDLKIDAVDISSERVIQARSEYNGINFYCENLENLGISSNSYDYIFSHYVYEHLNRPNIVTSELFRVLKKAGEIVLINPDGILENFFCDDIDLVRDIQRVCVYLRYEIVDNQAGRKLSHYLNKAGFIVTDEKVQVHQFNKEEMKKEALNYKIRFQFLGTYFDELLGKDRGLEVREKFLKKLESGECTLFQNKFIVRGIRP